MSDELTKKLKTYLLAAYTGGIIYKKASAAWEADVSDKLISGITKAFVEDGWISPAEVDRIGKQNEGFKERWNVMTGKDWFDRFEKEIYEINPKDMPSDVWMRMDVLAAAQRAAGLDKKGENDEHNR